MTSVPGPSLLERRLVIVTGKGGTGKTTVAAALALAASQRGLRVLVAEVGRQEHLPRLLVPGCPPVGYAGRELLPRLTAMRIEPFEALAEYLSLQLHSRRLVDLALRNRGFRQMMEAAPGWRELITLGKVWHLEQARTESAGEHGARQQRPAEQEPLYDLLVVDAPATGHGMTFLDVPRVVVSALHTGPLRRHAELVADMIRDNRHTVLLPVALAEELPARETVELVERARREVGISVDRIVVNEVARAPFPTELDDLDRYLAALPENTPLGGLPSLSSLAACATYASTRYALNHSYLEQISQRTALPVIPLPYLSKGVAGPEALLELAEALLEPPQRPTRCPH